jgi:surface antigen
MFRALFLAAPLVLVPLAASAPTANAATSAEQSRTGEQCLRSNRNRRRGGSVLGGIARGALGRFGGGAAANIVAPMGSMLGDAIMSLLDCDEQRQAATATEQVTERVDRDGVGASASWRSETRPGVAGSSTVTAVETRAPDGECLTITDIVIVDGQETTAPKRMCRRPPNNRYVRV